jgi:hypothetical protein
MRHEINQKSHHLSSLPSHYHYVHWEAQNGAQLILGK